MVASNGDRNSMDLENEGVSSSSPSSLSRSLTRTSSGFSALEELSAPPSLQNSSSSIGVGGFGSNVGIVRSILDCEDWKSGSPFHFSGFCSISEAQVLACVIKGQLIEDVTRSYRCRMRRENSIHRNTPSLILASAKGNGGEHRPFYFLIRVVPAAFEKAKDVLLSSAGSLFSLSKGVISSSISRVSLFAHQPALASFIALHVGGVSAFNQSHIPVVELFDDSGPLAILHTHSDPFLNGTQFGTGMCVGGERGVDGDEQPILPAVEEKQDEAEGLQSDPDHMSAEDPVGADELDARAIRSKKQFAARCNLVGTVVLAETGGGRRGQKCSAPVLHMVCPSVTAPISEHLPAEEVEARRVSVRLHHSIPLLASSPVRKGGLVFLTGVLYSANPLSGSFDMWTDEYSGKLM